MQSIQSVPEESSHPRIRTEPEPSAVYATLTAILQSQPFRTSKQCQDMLRYIVNHSLQGDDASLRERIIGIEVFGRTSDYDTSEDPVVRMRAADVRKRLAQFYQANDHELSVVHISLKPGSYRATFYQEHEETHETSPVVSLPVTVLPEINDPAVSDLPAQTLDRLKSLPTSRSKAWMILLPLVILLLAGVTWRVWAGHSRTYQERFWAPLTHSKQPVLLYVGANAVYRFTTEYLDRYQKEHGLKENGPEFFVDLPRGGTVQADDLVPSRDTFVSVAELSASAQVISLMHDWNKPYNLRLAADLSVGDIRNIPAILIGGFNNTWTLETTNDLPFSFQDGDRIENRRNPSQSWVADTRAMEPSKVDYALISRLLKSNTGGPVLSIGGVGSFGTQAAAEFVANPEKMSDLLKNAPAGWEGKNMQAVLRIKVVKFTPVAVDVVATTYW